MAPTASSVGDLLGDVPILAGLGEGMRAELVGDGNWLGLRAGEWLFRAGDPGDSLYVVGSGRLVALAPEEPSQVLREIGRGETIGELALLTGSPRSASVRARRDSRLLRVDRAAFERLLEEPRFSIAMLRGLGAQLQASRSLSAPSPAPAVIAIAAADPAAPSRRIAEAIAERMARWGPVETLGPRSAGLNGKADDRSAFAEALDQSERRSDCVLLSVEWEAEGDGAWRSFAIDQADRIVLVRGSDGAAVPGIGVDQRSDLLLYGEASHVPEGVLPRATYRVPESGAGYAEALDRIARRLSGRSVGVVLSGGGARGFAHIGALEGLAAAGAKIDRIGGCSMGALVGALFAAGHTIPEIEQICRGEMVERNPMNDYTLPVSGLIRRHKGEEMLRRMFGEQQIEALPLGYFCVSADLIAGELVVHSVGDLYRAVGASVCLPGVSPPVPDGGRLLVDGGLLDNLPVEAMATTMEGPVIAVDVSGHYVPRVRSARRPRAQRLEARLRRAVVGEEAPLPTLVETLYRTVVLGSTDTTEAAQRHAAMVIEPEVSGFGLTAFDQLEQISAAGRAAVEHSLAGDAPPWLLDGAEGEAPG